MSETTRSLPAFTAWPTFPFEGDLRVKKLQDPVATEPPRHGENPAECRACSAPDEAYIWVSERWRVRSLDRPTGLPAVLILESRSHLDLGDLPNMLAAELGVMTVRLERAIRSLDGVARVHVNRWGDGAAHLHVWFLARPYGRLQLQGTFLSLWDDILPTIPEEQWRENLAMVAAWLAEFGGRPLAEPPHIAWKAPARLIDMANDTTTAEDEEVVGVSVAGDAGALDETAAPEPASDSTSDRSTTAVPEGGPAPDTGAEAPKDAAPEVKSNNAATGDRVTDLAPRNATQEPDTDQPADLKDVAGDTAAASNTAATGHTEVAGHPDATNTDAGNTPAPAKKKS